MVCMGKSRKIKIHAGNSDKQPEGKLPVLHKRTAGVCHDIKAQTMVCFSSIWLCCLFLFIAFDTHQKEGRSFVVIL